MAGDWIKMREDLHEDPAILQIASSLRTRPEHVVGYCHRFWSWVSRQCHGGTVTHVTLESLESVLTLPGFLSLLRDVGWLDYDDSGTFPVIKIPKFERHLSEGSKSRLLAAERQRRSRHADVTKTSRSKRDKSVTREEKRRIQSVNEGGTDSDSLKVKLPALPSEVFDDDIQPEKLYRPVRAWWLAHKLGETLDADEVFGAILAARGKADPQQYAEKCLSCGVKESMVRRANRIRMKMNPNGAK